MPADSVTGCDQLWWIRETPTRQTGRIPGQVCDIKDCPHKGWGSGEKPPDFKVVHVPDKRKADFMHLMETHEEHHPNTREEDMLQFPPQTKVMIRRRRHVDITRMAAADQTAINDTPKELCHTIDAAKVEAVVADDQYHADLRVEQPKVDQRDALDQAHAEIAVGLLPEPPGYEATDRDIDAKIYAIDLEMAEIQARGGTVPDTYRPPHERALEIGEVTP
jgi:hypothetical protein